MVYKPWPKLEPPPGYQSDYDRICRLALRVSSGEPKPNDLDPFESYDWDTLAREKLPKGLIEDIPQ